jgi:hypothetical protein
LSCSWSKSFMSTFLFSAKPRFTAHSLE